MDCDFKIEIVKEIEKTDTEIKEKNFRGYGRNLEITKYVKVNKKFELEFEKLFYVTPDDKFCITSDIYGNYISVRSLENTDILESFGHEGCDTEIITEFEEELLPVIKKTKKFIRSGWIPLHLMKTPENTEFTKKHQIGLQKKLEPAEKFENDENYDNVEIDDDDCSFGDVFFTNIKQFENTSEVHGTITINQEGHALYFCIIFQKTNEQITDDNFRDYVTFCVKIENKWYYKGKSTINEEKCIDNRIFNLVTKHLNGFQEILPSKSYKKTEDSDDDDIIDLPDIYSLFYVSVTEKFCIIHDDKKYCLYWRSSKKPPIDIFGPIKEKIGEDIISKKFLHEKVSDDKIEIFGQLVSNMEKHSSYFKITLTSF